MARKTKIQQRKRIHLRIRKGIRGTQSVPRFSVFRSNNAIYCQLIDDKTGVTLAEADSRDASIAKDQPKVDQAKQVGASIAGKAKELNIEKVVFDRGGFLYHGRVKALADGARENGLKF